MDIAGFTAWSSTREPSQVFLLLETIYRCFDKISKSRRVFKVETIGDCYGKRGATRNPRFRYSWEPQAKGVFLTF